MLPLLLLLAAQASAQFAAPPVPKRVKIELNFPTLEQFALRTPLLLAGEGHGLTSQEREDAEALFGPSLDYDAVRVVFADFKGSKAMVAGNVIRLPKGDYSRRWLIHELVHVWQFQTNGASYISKALAAHAAKGDGAYLYTLVEGRALGDYEVEQQAEIVEDYYASAAKKKDPRYVKLIADLKKRRPAYRTNLSALEDASRLPLSRRMPELPTVAGPFDLTPLIPQLELRF